MKIKISGRSDSMEEIFLRLREALNKLPINEVDHYTGVNFYFIPYDDNGNQITFIDKYGSEITEVINKYIKKKEVKAD